MRIDIDKIELSVLEENLEENSERKVRTEIYDDSLVFQIKQRCERI